MKVITMLILVLVGIGGTIIWSVSTERHSFYPNAGWSTHVNDELIREVSFETLGYDCKKYAKEMLGIEGKLNCNYVTERFLYVGQPYCECVEFKW